MKIDPQSKKKTNILKLNAPLLKDSLAAWQVSVQKSHFEKGTKTNVQCVGDWIGDKARWQSVE